MLYFGLQETKEAAESHPFLKSFVARDLVWLLDVFGDRLTLTEQQALAREARDFDPDFVGTNTRLGLLAALLGDWSTARDAVAKAESIGRTVDVHQDALFEAQATRVVVECIALTLGRSPGSARRKDEQTTALTYLDRLIGQLSAAHIFESDRDEVVRNLRDLVAMVRWLSDGSDSVMSPIRTALQGWRAQEVDISRFRSPAEGAHQSVAIFEATVRNFERAVIYVSQAVGEAIDLSVFNEYPGVRGFADVVRQGRNGVHWIEGWVIEPVDGASTFCGALALDAGSGGGAAPASITRADIDSLYGDPQGSASGYRLAVPLAMVTTEPGEVLSRICGLSSSGYRSKLAFPVPS